MSNPDLEAFVDEMIKLSIAKGYKPRTFMSLRAQFKTIPAITMLVQQDDVQSGFKRLHKLKLTEWTIEAAVEKFPDDFSKHDREYADFRLKQAREGKPVI